MSVSPTTRSSLIVRLSNRADSLAWEEFVDLYSPLIRRVAISRGMQDADACEIVQEVFIAIIKSIPHYQQRDQPGSFRSWLTTIARNKTLNRLSRLPLDVAKRANHAILEDVVSKRASNDTEQNDAEQVNEMDLRWRQQIFVLAAEEVRMRVHPNTWTAFWMTAVEDRDCETVGNDLGLSVGAVYVARSRVLAKIREWVRSHSCRWELNTNDR